MDRMKRVGGVSCKDKKVTGQTVCTSVNVSFCVFASAQVCARGRKQGEQEREKAGKRGVILSIK